MGHADPRMTMEHYAHLSPEYDPSTRFARASTGSALALSEAKSSRRARSGLREDINGAPRADPVGRNPERW